MLNETAPPVVGQAIQDDLVRHLKLSDPVDAPTIGDAEAAFRAALSHVEAQLGLALIKRNFVWHGHIPAGKSLSMPMAPVLEITNARTIPRFGDAKDIDLSKVSLVRSNLRAELAIGIACAGAVEIAFVAGFGDSWTHTPADLRQAVLLLTAHYFDTRHAAARSEPEIPHGVLALLAPWRPLRLGFGGGQ